MAKPNTSSLTWGCIRINLKNRMTITLANDGGMCMHVPETDLSVQVLLSPNCSAASLRLAP